MHAERGVMDEKKLIQHMDKLFGRETRRGPKTETLTEDPGYQIDYHPGNDVILSYLRGELNRELRSPEEVMQGVIRGDLAGWHSPEIAAHIRICDKCRSVAEDLKQKAVAQRWWETACKETIRFLEKYYTEQVNRFRESLDSIGRQPKERVLGFSYYTAPSPIGAWGLGEEETKQDKEGLSFLSMFASIVEELSLETIGKTAVSKSTLRKIVKEKLRNKNAPTSLAQQVIEYLQLG